jgi:F0F1-type ATP synthase assembly protein I
MNPEVPKNSDPRQRDWRKSGIALGAGWLVVSSLLVSVLIGLGLDRLFHTDRLFLVIMFLVGLTAGMYNLVRELRKLEDSDGPESRQ